MSKCSPRCMYFPNEKYSNVDYETDESGVKKSLVQPICNYDDERITCWKECKNYKKFPGNKKEKIIALIGLSASGKDTILNYLIKNNNLSPIISHTTRPIREKEIDGVDYYFISEKQFNTMKQNNEFIDTKEVNALFNGNKSIWLYGTHKNEIYKPNKKVCVTDSYRLKSLINYYGKENIISIFIDVEDKERKKRAINRGTFSIEEWERRELSDKKHLTDEFFDKYIDHVVKNDLSVRILEKKIELILRERNRNN